METSFWREWLGNLIIAILLILLIGVFIGGIYLMDTYFTGYWVPIGVLLWLVIWIVTGITIIKRYG